MNSTDCGRIRRYDFRRIEGSSDYWVTKYILFCNRIHGLYACAICIGRRRERERRKITRFLGRFSPIYLLNLPEFESERFRRKIANRNVKLRAREDPEIKFMRYPHWSRTDVLLLNQPYGEFDAREIQSMEEIDVVRLCETHPNKRLSCSRRLNLNDKYGDKDTYVERFTVDVHLEAETEFMDLVTGFTRSAIFTHFKISDVEKLIQGLNDQGIPFKISTEAWQDFVERIEIAEWEVKN